jgi:hypothetical protein
MIQKLVIILLGLMILFPKPQAAIYSSNYSKKDTVLLIQKSNVDNEYQEYQEILEKTNNQLSLWVNPYGILVAILGVFFTIMAILAAVILYRQSKESKQLIKDSLDKHQIALDRLITEKKEQLDYIEENYDKIINEYKQKLEEAEAENRNQISEFIDKLEKQKKSLDSQLNSHRHSGWKPQDINKNYDVTKETNFYAKITLNQINESFVIYYRVVTSDNQKYWIGFGGNIKNDINRSKHEFTRHQIYNTREIIINENVNTAFNLGFSNLSTQVKQIDCIRLRGNNIYKEDILFEFKIM